MEAALEIQARPSASPPTLPMPKQCVMRRRSVDTTLIVAETDDTMIRGPLGG